VSTGLSVEITVPLQRFTLEASFHATAASMGIFGDSGAGKTTLLESIAGLRDRASGKISFGGRTWLDTGRRVNLPPEARGIGYVPQDALLFPHWRVRENILAGAGRHGGGTGRSIDADQVIRVLEIGDLLDRSVAGLSGGEGQRVALARALCSSPSLLLLDEPLGSIQQSLRAKILPYLIAVKEEFRIPTLFVSHDAAEVEILCDEVIVLRQGRAVGAGAPHLVFTGPDLAEGLTGDAYENILGGTVARTDREMAEITLDAGPSLLITATEAMEIGTKVLLGIRAAEILIALGDPPGLSARNTLPGTVREVQPVEDGVLVKVSLGDGRPELAVMVTVAACRALDLRQGKAVRLVAKARSFHLLAVR
jgi:molybdate transport system ATP-binding protein